jgi:hypothetical protein
MLARTEMNMLKEPPRKAAGFPQRLAATGMDTRLPVLDQPD